MIIQELLPFIESMLSGAKNAQRAKYNEAYLKYKFEFYGVDAPTRKILLRDIKVKVKSLTIEEVFQFVELLWKQPYREFHYIAIDLLQWQKRHWDKSYLLRVEKLIISNSWWDSVDGLASNIAGLILQKNPTIRMEWIDKWNSSENVWLNRSAIIHQLRYKERVDLDLLFALVESHIGSKEFFINKACGWALRQASKFYPEEVYHFILDHPNLSTLTKREGEKYLNK